MYVLLAIIVISILILLFLVALFVLFLLLTPFWIKPNGHRDVSDFSERLYAHRGLHDDVIPENSLAAFREAVKNGYGVELDVQMTRDGKLVVFHDGNLLRMCGINALLKDFTYEELLRFNLKNTQEKIPLFEDVLAVLGKADLVCEIKSDNGHKNYTLCEKTYDMLRTYPGNYCIESFSPFLVSWFKKYHPEIIRGQLSQRFTRKDKMKWPVRFFMSNLLVNVVSRPDFISYRHQDSRKWGFRLVKFLYNPFLVAWTARGDEEIKSAFNTFDSVIFEKGK